jgi:hypothetical protein
VYALILERLERHVLAERQVAAIAKLGGGAKGSPLPTFEGERLRLDRLLELHERRSYPKEQAQLIAALGLRG